VTSISGTGTDVTPEEHLPEVAHAVAIIMDGNGRWAVEHGVSVADGHRAGSRALRPVVETAIELGIDSLAVYAFSTENWSRSGDEVAALMETFGETIDRELEDLAEQGVRCRFLGRRDRAPDWLRAKMEKLEAATGDKSTVQLWIAFDYGGRAELVDAARQLLESGSEPDDVDEAAFAACLYEPEMPDPDLVIRTSGERRVSNFLLWQSAYAEYVFTDTLWPDFGPEELRTAIEEYARRRRRFGGR
jgi:undecaprenyl diphosphate synthase